MILLALLIGIFSYTIFFLGISGLIEKQSIILLNIFLVFSLGLIFYKKFNAKRITSFFSLAKNDKVIMLFFVLLLLQSLINFIGLVGPELSFDGLWYHLTIPKIFLAEHKILFIPGGLLYYSLMPKLIEVFSLLGVVLFGDFGVKLIHFILGLLTLFVLYKTARNFLNEKFSVLAVVIFYSNLVVGWESITAFVDLGRTFFEILTFFVFLLYRKERNTRNLILLGICIGLAIATKLLAIGTLVIFFILLAYDGFLAKDKIILLFKKMLLLSVTSFFTVLPWFLFSYIHTNNIVYPFFTSLYPSSIDQQIFSSRIFVADFMSVFLFSPDPISPIYMIVLPIMIIFYAKIKKSEYILVLYVLLSLFVWYISPRTGGGRFLLPYLPAMSILCAIYVERMKKSFSMIYTILIISIILIALSSVVYRAVANAKFLQVILKQESTSSFLKNHLNFSFGDFYDTDGFFKKLSTSDTVLLFGFHNLNYVNFRFIDSTWIKEGDTFNYIATQNTKLPERFRAWEKIYSNNTTHVSVYTNKKHVWRY